MLTARQPERDRLIMNFLEDTYFWYTVSFIGFVFVLVKFGWPAFLKFIDARIESIRTEIERAESLYTEAHELLAQYQRKHRDAVQEADHIIKTAEKNAADLKAQAKAELEEIIARREKQLQERLKRMEEQAFNEVRQYTANLAIDATAKIIAEKLDQKANQNLVDASIKSIAKSI